MLTKAEILYPNHDFSYGPGSYTPIVNDLGEVLVRVDDDNYQGDTRVLLKRGDRYGFVIIGWGSCSGCDALQATKNYDDINRLIDAIEHNVKWGATALDMWSYFVTKDWDLEYSWRAKETKHFVDEVLALLKDLK